MLATGKKTKTTKTTNANNVKKTRRRRKLKNFVFISQFFCLFQLAYNRILIVGLNFKPLDSIKKANNQTNERTTNKLCNRITTMKCSMRANERVKLANLYCSRWQLVGSPQLKKVFANELSWSGLMLRFESVNDCFGIVENFVL